jgi:hypothetical protein
MPVGTLWHICIELAFTGLRQMLDLLGSIDYTLDNEFPVLVLASFRNFECFKCICKFESMCQEWFEVDQSSRNEINSERTP